MKRSQSYQDIIEKLKYKKMDRIREIQQDQTLVKYTEMKKNRSEKMKPMQTITEDIGKISLSTKSDNDIVVPERPNKSERSKHYYKYRKLGKRLPESKFIATNKDIFKAKKGSVQGNPMFSPKNYFIKSRPCTDKKVKHIDHVACCNVKEYYIFLHKIIPSLMSYNKVSQIEQDKFYSQLRELKNKFPEPNKLNLEALHPNFSKDFNKKETEETHQNYVSLTLSIEELQKVDNNAIGDTNIHSLSTEAVKDKIINWHNLRDMMEGVLIPLEKTETPEAEAKVTLLKTRIEHFNNLIQEHETKLEQIARLKSEFKERLTLPKYGDKDEVDIEKCRLYVPIFRGPPDNDTTLEEVWQKIVCFSQNENLSEKAIKHVLSCVLQSNPYTVYFENRDKTLTEILSILIARFAHVLNISDHDKILKSLKREPKEKLASVMSRCSILLDKTKYLNPPDEREARHKIYMVDYLLKLCSSKAKFILEAKRTAASRSGYNLTYQNMLQMAEDIERSEIDPETTASLYTFSMRDERDMINFGGAGGKTNTIDAIRRARKHSPYNRDRSRSPSRSTFNPRSASPSPNRTPNENVQAKFEQYKASNQAPVTRSQSQEIKPAEAWRERGREPTMLRRPTNIEYPPVRPIRPPQPPSQNQKQQTFNRFQSPVNSAQNQQSQRMNTPPPHQRVNTVYNPTVEQGGTNRATQSQQKGFYDQPFAPNFKRYDESSFRSRPRPRTQQNFNPNFNNFQNQGRGNGIRRTFQNNSQFRPRLLQSFNYAPDRNIYQQFPLTPFTAVCFRCNFAHYGQCRQQYQKNFSPRNNFDNTHTVNDRGYSNNNRGNFNTRGNFNQRSNFNGYNRQPRTPDFNNASHYNQLN